MNPYLIISLINAILFASVGFTFLLAGNIFVPLFVWVAMVVADTWIRKRMDRWDRNHRSAPGSSRVLVESNNDVETREIT